MVRGFRDRRTQRLHDGERVPVFEAFRHQAEKRLRILEAATSFKDLRDLRSNRFEALTGDRSGQFSIRINERWRICFTWPKNSNGPDDVEIVDYH
jgi:proteic killer suppression protein